MSGTLSAEYATVGYSDASGGSEGTAAVTCVDDGANANWAFGAVAGGCLGGCYGQGDTVNFEVPAYTVATNLVGQDGWMRKWAGVGSDGDHKIRQEATNELDRVFAGRVTPMVRGFPRHKGDTLELWWRWRAQSTDSKVCIAPDPDTSRISWTWDVLAQRVCMDGGGQYHAKGADWVDRTGWPTYDANTWYYERLRVNLATRKYSWWHSPNADRSGEVQLVNDDATSSETIDTVTGIVITGNLGIDSVDIDDIFYCDIQAGCEAGAVESHPRRLYWNPQAGNDSMNVPENWTTDAAGTIAATMLHPDDTMLFGGSGLGADSGAAMYGNLSCAGVDFAGYTGTFDFSSYALTVSRHDAAFVTGMTVEPGTGRLVLSAPADTQTFAAAGLTFPTVEKTGAGTVAMGNANAAFAALRVMNGTWDWGDNGNTFVLDSVVSTGGAMDFGTATVQVTTGNANLGGLAAIAPGTGSLAFTAGAGTQVLTPAPGVTHPPVTHTGSGTLQLSANDLTALSFTNSGGPIDLNGRDLTTGASISVTSGTASTFVNLAGRTLTVGGSAYFEGQEGDPLNMDPGSAWAIDATGRLLAVHAQTANSNATGSQGRAGATCTNGGGNTNWLFDPEGPDNDMTLTATAIDTHLVEIAWTPGAIDSADAEMVGVWYKTGDYPDSVGDPTATQWGTFALSDSLDTVLVPATNTVYYFAVMARDSSTNWSDTALSACDTAYPKFEDYGNWTFSENITLNTSPTGANVTGDNLNFPVLVRLRDHNFTFAQANADGSDIRFAKADGTHLQYEIERCDNGGEVAEIWAKVDTVRGSNASQYVTMHWGKADALPRSNGAAVFDTGNGFVGVWHLGDDGGPYVDVTANGYHGTGSNMGDSDDTASLIGAGQCFDRSNSERIYMAPGPALANKGFTLSAWAKRAGTENNEQYVVTVGNTGSTRQICYVGYWPNNQAMAGMWLIEATGPTTSSTEWIYWTSTFDSISDTLRLYMDGVNESRAYASGNYVGAPELHVGYRVANEMYFDGLIDEVRAEILPRSASWIRLCYENQRNNAQFLSIDHPDTVAPANVTAFDAVFVDDDTVALSWTASGTVDAESTVVRYRTDGSYPSGKSGGSLWAYYDIATQADTVTGLVEKQKYWFGAFVKDTIGNWCMATSGARDTVTIPDQTPPANVDSLSAVALGKDSISLSWVRSPAADAESTVVRYRTDGSYPASRTDGTLAGAFAAGVSNCMVPGLAEKTTWWFSAFVRDSVGNWSLTAAGSRDTAATPDLTFPVADSLVIALSGRFTNDTDPAVRLYARRADSMQVALAPSVPFAWKPLAAIDSIDIGAGGDGTKVVRARFKDTDDSLTVWVSDSIIYDGTAPATMVATTGAFGPASWPEAVTGTAADNLSGVASISVRISRAGGGFWNGASWASAETWLAANLSVALTWSLYWYKPDTTVKVSLARAQLVDTLVVVRLSRAEFGWNQIASPYPYPVRWSGKGALWRWDAAERDFTEADTVLDPWQGYWVLIDSSRQERIVNKPLFAAPVLAKQARHYYAGPTDWRIQFEMRSCVNRDAANAIGFSRAASDGIDEMDRPEPPRLPGHPYLFVYQPAWREGITEYASDIRHRMQPSMNVFQLGIYPGGAEAGEVKVYPRGIDALSGLHVYLADRDGLVELSDDEAFTVPPGDGVVYRALVVTERDRLWQRVPSSFAMLQPMPNPFGFSSTIRYELPLRWEGDGRFDGASYMVTLRIYDSHGRAVRDLVVREQEPGYYAVVWNGRGNNGSRVPGGSYACRLEAGQHSTTKVLVLVR